MGLLEESQQLIQSPEFSQLGPSSQVSLYRRLLTKHEPDFAGLQDHEQEQLAQKFMTEQMPGTFEGLGQKALDVGKAAVGMVPGIGGGIEGYQSATAHEPANNWLRAFTAVADAVGGEPYQGMEKIDEQLSDPIQRMVMGAGRDVATMIGVGGVAGQLGIGERVAARLGYGTADVLAGKAFLETSAQTASRVANQAASVATINRYVTHAVDNLTAGEMFGILNATERGELHPMEDLVYQPLMIAGIGVGLMGAGGMLKRFGKQAVADGLKGLQESPELAAHVQDAQRVAASVAKANGITPEAAADVTYRAALGPLTPDEGAFVKMGLMRDPELMRTQMGQHLVRMQRDIVLEPNFTPREEGPLHVQYEPMKDGAHLADDRLRRDRTIVLDSDEDLIAFGNKWRDGDVHVMSATGPEGKFATMGQLRQEVGTPYTPKEDMAPPVVAQPGQQEFNLGGRAGPQVRYAEGAAGPGTQGDLFQTVIYKASGEQIGGVWRSIREAPEMPRQLEYKPRDPFAPMTEEEIGPYGGSRPAQPAEPQFGAGATQRPTGSQPAPIVNNASGESAASVEAVKRVKAEKRQGLQRVKVDARSGKMTPLLSVDAVDVMPQPHEFTATVDAKGNVKILDKGAKANPAMIKAAVEKIKRLRKEPIKMTDKEQKATLYDAIDDNPHALPPTEAVAAGEPPAPALPERPIDTGPYAVGTYVQVPGAGSPQQVIDVRRDVNAVMIGKKWWSYDPTTGALGSPLKSKKLTMPGSTVGAERLKGAPQLKTEDVKELFVLLKAGEPLIIEHNGQLGSMRYDPLDPQGTVLMRGLGDVGIDIPAGLGMVQEMVKAGDMKIYNTRAMTPEQLVPLAQQLKADATKMAEASRQMMAKDPDTAVHMTASSLHSEMSGEIVDRLLSQKLGEAYKTIPPEMEADYQRRLTEAVDEGTFNPCKKR